VWGIMALKFRIHLYQMNPEVSRLKKLKLRCSKMDVWNLDHLPK
jgi:hypothetical protein